MTQFPVPFGKGTSRLASDPAHGVVWFATAEGEFSSISPSGNVGARGCVGGCGNPIEVWPWHRTGRSGSRPDTRAA